ncbi:hypothetical protein BSLG_002498 [Batrachochytrium salamandrivorans]|nr:hypothetical protein BSLG_002498 [Batrachochytrium salamandrivorans]
MDWATQSDDPAALLAQETASAATTNSSAPSAETLIVHTLEQRSLVHARTLPAQYQRAAEAALSSTDDDALALLPLILCS